MSDVLLVLNAGSSSLRFSVFLDGATPQPLLRGHFEELGNRPRFTARDASTVVEEREWPAGTRLDHGEAVDALLEWSANGVLRGYRLIAAGHRVVHGGSRFVQPVLVEADTLAALRALMPFAPLHQPQSVAAIEAVARAAPGLPQVACFDTAFHSTQPEVARTFALPARFADEGIQRYGFHGLSYEYVAAALEEIDRRCAKGRTVVAHLGNGASMCAMRGGRSAATTMGFTALDGLVMGTRCGALDPGVVLYLVEERRMTGDALRRLLYEESGLLGVSGVSSDMRVLLGSSDPRARVAVDLFVYRVARELGSLAAALGGLDGVVFTGGIGENSTAIRARICRDAWWLGVELDEEANVRGGPRISTPGSAVAVWVIPTNEEVLIARHTRRVIESSGRLAAAERSTVDAL
jgi:acetate kinase